MITAWLSSSPACFSSSPAIFMYSAPLNTCEYMTYEMMAWYSSARSSFSSSINSSREIGPVEWAGLPLFELSKLASSVLDPNTLQGVRGTLTHDRLPKDLSVSDGAVSFLAGFHGAHDGRFHVVDGLLRSALPPSSRRCRIIYPLFHAAGDIFA